MRTRLPSQPAPRGGFLSLAFLSALGWLAPTLRGADAPPPLWQLGQRDNLNAEFAFAPKDYARFRTDGFHIVGRSDPRVDWPYAQPGPVDAWGGNRPHHFTIAFGLQAAPPAGTCRLLLDFLDTHGSAPPRLRVEINGTRHEKNAPRGTGDATVFGDPTRGKEWVWELAFPADQLRAGNNEITLTSLTGSWALYDAIQLFAPAGTTLSAVSPGTRLVDVRIPPVWLKDGDAAAQPINLTVRHIGDAAEGTVSFDGAAATPVRLQPGLQTLELKAPAASQPRQLGVTLRTGAQVVLTTNLPIQPPPLRDLWILPHSHVDIGYTHRQEEIVQAQIAHLEKAMELARASAVHPPGMRFKWNPEAVWSLDHFLQRATPEKREAFLSAVRRRDVGVDALFGNMLTGLCRPEELVQALAFGARLSNLTGLPVESAAICDVPGWTWGLVPIMAHAGVRYFAIGPNFGDRVGTIHVWDNRPFYWKSQSGQERLLCWVVDNYHHLGNLEEHVLAHAEKLDSIDFPYDTSFLFWVGQWPGGAVDNAPPDEKTVDKVVAWNAKYAAPRLTIGLAGEFFRAFERRHGPQVPEFSGDLTPYWEDGAGSTSRETALNRASADRLSQAEALYAMRRHAPPPLADFDAAWKNVLLYSEHTWGAWNSISDPDNPFVLDQWKVKQAFALDADRQSRQLLALALAPTPNATPLTPPAIDVYNPTQWKRTDLAVLPSEVAGEAVLDDRGRAVPFQKLSSGERVFLAADLPPFGARRFQLASRTTPSSGSARATPTSLHTRTLSVEIDPRSGAVRSLRLARLAHDFVDAHAPVALNDYRYVLGTDAAGAQTNGPARITILDPGPLVATLRIESDAPGCNRLVREVRVIDGLDHVELVNHVDRPSVRQKDAVHFGFGFDVPNGQIRMETPWAVVRPNLDQLPGACRNWFTVQRWVDVSNPRHGITWAPLDAPLMQIGGITANLLGSVAFQEWMTNAIDSQTIYSWAQNNHWHTNYKIDQPGVTTFRYLLRPHRRGYSGADAARFGVETSRPLVATAALTRTSPPRSLLQVSSPDVLVETVKVSHDARALIIRLFGVSGTPQSTRISWPGFKPTRLHLTDLTEKPLRPAPARIPVPAYGIVHLRAELP